MPEILAAGLPALLELLGPAAAEGGALAGGAAGAGLGAAEGLGGALAGAGLEGALAGGAAGGGLGAEVLGAGLLGGGGLAADAFEGASDVGGGFDALSGGFDAGADLAPALADTTTGLSPLADTFPTGTVDISTLGTDALGSTTTTPGTLPTTNFADAADTWAAGSGATTVPAGLPPVTDPLGGWSFPDLSNIGNVSPTSTMQPVTGDFVPDIGALGGGTPPDATLPLGSADLPAGAQTAVGGQVPGIDFNTAATAPPGVTTAGGVTGIGGPTADISTLTSGTPTISGTTTAPGIASLGGSGPGAAAVAAPTGVSDTLDLTSLAKGAKDSLFGKDAGWLSLAAPAVGAAGLARAFMTDKTTPETAAITAQQNKLQGTSDALSKLGVDALTGADAKAAPIQKLGTDLIQKSQDQAKPILDKGLTDINAADADAKALQAKGLGIVDTGQQTLADATTAGKAQQAKGEGIIDSGQKILGESQAQARGEKQLGGDIIGAGQAQGQALDALGNPLIQTGSDYTKYLAAGTLPPDLQAQLDTDTKAQKQAVISRFAAQGMSPDPKKNSQLQRALVDIDNQARIKAGQLAEQLLTAGTQVIGAGNQTVGSATSRQAQQGTLGANLLTGANQTLNTGAGVAGTQGTVGTNLLQTGNQTINTGAGVASTQGSIGTKLGDQALNAKKVAADTGLGELTAGTTLQTGGVNAGANVLQTGTQAGSAAANTGANLLSTGASLTGMDNSLLLALKASSDQKNAQIGNAIASFAAALAPSKGVTLQLPKAA